MKLKTRKRRSTKRQLKPYTRSAKRALRLRRRTRRKLSGRKIQWRHRSSMRGGAATGPGPNNGATVPVDKTASSGQNPSAINASMREGSRDQNAGNQALKGGSGRVRQTGGRNLAMYAYTPPPGMMGPIPQPSNDAITNKLILQAAKIDTMGQANAVYDNNVNNPPVKPS